MVQYANPHQQQPRDQYGRPYPQQGGYPQPQQQPAPPPVGSIMQAPDGRHYQWNGQSWVAFQDPRMLQQSQYPQQMPPQGFQQPPMQPQYPVYQAPNQAPQMPVYGLQNGPQPTVFANPNQRAGNRFGGSGAATEPPRTATPANTYQPSTPQPSSGENSMQLVSNGKTSLRKNALKTPSFRVAVRTNVFNETNAVKYADLIVSDCLDELVEAAIEKTVNHERSPAALVSDAVLELIYHKADHKKFADDLFQSDIKAVYKAFKTHLSTVNNRYDFVYLSAINDYLTELVNDTLYPILNAYPMVTNFMEDFNELLRNMRNKCSPEVEDLFLQNVNEVLTKTQTNFLILDSINGAAEDGVEETPPSTPRALIPIPVQVICLNYLNTELGDNDNLAHILGGLTEMVSGPMAYVCTIDKTIYKAFFGGEKVLVDLIRD